MHSNSSRHSRSNIGYILCLRTPTSSPRANRACESLPEATNATARYSDDLVPVCPLALQSAVPFFPAVARPGMPTHTTSTQHTTFVADRDVGAPQRDTIAR